MQVKNIMPFQNDGITLTQSGFVVAQFIAPLTQDKRRVRSRAIHCASYTKTKDGFVVAQFTRLLHETQSGFVVAQFTRLLHETKERFVVAQFIAPRTPNITCSLIYPSDLHIATLPWKLHFYNFFHFLHPFHIFTVS